MIRHRRRRRGTIALDVVLCTVLAVGLAAAGYALVRTALGAHVSFIGVAVGRPEM